jgi:hypothetical protein
MKEMTSVATTVMTEGEKAEVEKEMNTPLSAGPSSPPLVSLPGTPPPNTQSHTPASAATPTPSVEAHAPENNATSPPLDASPVTDPGSPAGTGTGTKPSKPHPDQAKRRAKLTPEQKAKLQEIDEERRKARQERIALLTTKLVERLRPFVEAERPGDKDDPETLAFEKKMRREAEDLKLESFGLELLHVIGGVYMMKAGSFMKSKKFLGM